MDSSADQGFQLPRWQWGSIRQFGAVQFRIVPVAKTPRPRYRTDLVQHHMRIAPVYLGSEHGQLRDRPEALGSNHKHDGPAIHLGKPRHTRYQWHATGVVLSAPGLKLAEPLN